MFTDWILKKFCLLYQNYSIIIVFFQGWKGKGDLSGFNNFRNFNYNALKISGEEVDLHFLIPFLARTGWGMGLGIIQCYFTLKKTNQRRKRWEWNGFLVENWLLNFLCKRGSVNCSSQGAGKFSQGPGC